MKEKRKARDNATAFLPYSATLHPSPPHCPFCFMSKTGKEKAELVYNLVALIPPCHFFSGALMEL